MHSSHAVPNRSTGPRTPAQTCMFALQYQRLQLLRAFSFGEAVNACPDNEFPIVRSPRAQSRECVSSCECSRLSSLASVCSRARGYPKPVPFPPRLYLLHERFLDVFCYVHTVHRQRRPRSEHMIVKQIDFLVSSNKVSGVHHHDCVWSSHR